jgi:hypothetical protein
MKFTSYKFALALLAAVAFSACKKDNPNPVEPAGEYRYVRVLVADGTSNKITQVSPVDGRVESFDAPHPNAALYRSGTGRYAGMLWGTQNLTRFFDTGLEFHVDHVDVKGTPKFAAITSAGPRPAHFKSHGKETMIFNDGDGTLSVANEADFHQAGATMRVVETGVVPHHGAMTKFENGNYAITVKDENIEAGAPHGVKIINANGAQVHPATQAVRRIHGNATDGTNAVFGVEGGVLVVSQNGQQRIIPNVADWGTTRFGTILYGEGANRFVAFTNLKGVYTVNLSNNTISPIFESTSIMQVKLDLAGNNLLVLMLDGTLRVYDLANGNLQREGNVIPATATSETLKPVLEATSKYAYIILPNQGELLQVNLADFADVQRHQVSGQPTRLVVLGHETNESH